MLKIIDQELHFSNQRHPPTETLSVVAMLEQTAAPKHGRLACFNHLKVFHKNEGSLEGGGTIR
jgi:hypothetical protein